MVALIMKAGNVTPEEALQKAENFLQNKYSTHRASGTFPTLTMTRPISGLYVFNVGKNDGFIIVSPDDSTVEILGYSNSGQINPDNIPDNMRAWLQGYADEIAWAKERQTTDNGNRHTAKAPRRADRTDVEPLLQTHWTQSGTFAAKCIFDDTQTVTGCVATAMAQVMYYHQWPNVIIDKIPAYTTATKGYDVAAIPAGTVIDWNNILQEYEVYLEEGEQYGTRPPNHTTEQANAVAELLHYCGASVSMDYTSNSSGAQSAEIPFALFHYFNYNQTAQFLNRDSYSADDWDEIIYHEVKNRRPVLYGGQSSGGGHEFVCDGYNTDGTFHINWGWQGMSNGYFVLSALDPYQQGIGGSSSTDGYNSQQDVVIGIQKPDATGEVSTAVSNATGISLQLLEVSFSENPTISGNEVTVTATIKNNSVNDYDSYFSIWESQLSGSLPVYRFKIESGETKIYTQSVSPSEGAIRYNIGYVKDNYLWPICKTNELCVYPQNVTKTMNAYGWATFSSEYPLDFSLTDLEAYIVTGSNGNTILKSPVTTVPANTGLIISGTANDSFTIPVTLATADDVTGNKLVAVPTQITVNKATDGNENFVLSVQNGKVVFARINDNTATVPAGYAYLTLSAEATSPWLTIDDEEETTSLRETINVKSDVSTYYTLDGKRVTNPTEGIYIMNGKKVFIKKGERSQQ